MRVTKAELLKENGKLKRELKSSTRRADYWYNAFMKRGKELGDNVATWKDGYSINQSAKSNNLSPFCAGDNVIIRGLVTVASSKLVCKDNGETHSEITFDVLETRRIKNDKT